MGYEIEAGEPVSLAVVRAVSTYLSRDPCSIRPLAGVIDPDALDALFSPQDDGTHRLGGQLSFVYSNCKVTIENSEYIAVSSIKPGQDGRSNPGYRSTKAE